MSLALSRYRARRPIPSRVIDDGFTLGGGLNQTDSPLEVQPGELLACKNYEIAPSGRGYRRVKGYERYAKEVIPSDAAYTIVQYVRATEIPAEGVIVEGGSSGAKGYVLAVTETQSVSIINLALRSEEFNDGVVWTLDGVTIDETDIENPFDGELTASFIEETTADTEHVSRQTITKDSTARSYWVSIFVRPRGGTAHAALRAFFNVSFAQVLFDFSAGSASAPTEAGDYTGLLQHMQQLDDDWWRIGVKFTSNVQTTVSAQIMCGAPGGLLVYPGSAGRGLEVFGFQFEETDADSVAPSAYVATDSAIRGNGAGEYALLQTLSVTGTFTNGEQLSVFGGDPLALANGASSEDGASTDELDAEYRAASITLNRSLIEAVPGSGPIRGVAIYNGRAYALRDNAAATAGVLYQASDNAWNVVPLGRKLLFNGGVTAIAAGTLVNGETSGSTGTVLRTVVTSGAFDTSDAAGFLIFATVTGAFQNGENIRIVGVTAAVALGIDFAQTLSPGGRMEHRVHNFFGHSSTERLYAVDGVNKAFEYQDNPEFFCQIDTGMDDDAPTHLGIHDNQLFLAFSGGSLQRSSVGEPAVWDVALGATEFALGEEITGILEEIGETLFIFTRNKTKYLLGDAANYELKTFSPDTGAHEWTIQRIGQGIYLDDRGLTSLNATQKFGNYQANSFSAKAATLVSELREIGVTDSCVVKKKNLCRIFFEDGQFLSIGVNGSKITGITNGDLGLVVRCVASGEDADGNELIVFGSDDGFIYRMESGPSFDSSVLQAFFRTAFHFSSSPQRRKRYRRAAIHVKTEGACTFKVGTDYSFADPGEAIETIREVALTGGGGLWNVSQWNEFRWSTAVVTNASIKLNASGENIGFLISHEADDEDEHTISSIMLALSPRRRNRGAAHG